MAKLYRPSIPVQVKCRVALRQLGYSAEDISRCIRENLFVPRAQYGGKGLRRYLDDFLIPPLAKKLGCEVEDLRLDHDPPLALRPQERRGLGRKTYYTPDANDPEHLKYRPHGAQFDGSHDVKTRIRGEHGQFSDIALIKRQRRREKPPTERQARMAQLRERQKKLRRAMKRTTGKKAKSRWPSRPFRSKKSPR